MKSCLSLIVVLCLASGLWIGADAQFRQDLCTDGWIHYGCNCFKYFGEQKTWADAEHFCLGQGGNLASIHNNLEHQFVRRLIKSASGRDDKVYVGGHDRYKEGKWSWSDGKNFVFPGWYRGEPNNNGGNEDCMELNFHNMGNDIPCSLRRAFVCSRPV
ncbi:galactose-specific lectin nattectin-like [Synchiropus picturatus]